MNKASSKFKIGKKCVLLSTVAPWAYKDKKLLTFKISTKILAIFGTVGILSVTNFLSLWAQWATVYLFGTLLSF